MSKFELNEGSFSSVLTLSRSLPASYIDSSGVLQNVVASEPRFAPDGGLLIERSSQNVLLKSRLFNQSPWAGSGTGSASTAYTGIDGVANSSRELNDTSSSSVFSMSQSVAVTPSSTSTNIVSVFIQKTSAAVTFPAVGVAYSGGTALESVVFFNTDTGAFEVDGDDAGVAVVDHGKWWRLIIDRPNNGTANDTLTLSLYPAANSTGKAGFNVSSRGATRFDVAQVEPGVISATGPMVTDDSPVFRIGELAACDLSSLQSAKGFSFVAEFSEIRPSITGGFLVYAYDASGDNYAGIEPDELTGRLLFADRQDGGAVTYTDLAKYSGRFKCGISCDLERGELVIAANGFALVLKRDFTAASFDSLGFNRNDSTSNPLESFVIKRVQLFASPLSREHMKELTTQGA